MHAGSENVVGSARIASAQRFNKFGGLTLRRRASLTMSMRLTFALLARPRRHSCGANQPTQPAFPATSRNVSEGRGHACQDDSRIEWSHAKGRADGPRSLQSRSATIRAVLFVFYRDWRPGFVRIESLHLYKLTERSRSEIPLVDNSVLADHEALHPGLPVLGGCC